MYGTNVTWNVLVPATVTSGATEADVTTRGTAASSTRRRLTSPRTTRPARGHLAWTSWLVVAPRSRCMTNVPSPIRALASRRGTGVTSLVGTPIWPAPCAAACCRSTLVTNADDALDSTSYFIASASDGTVNALTVDSVARP